MPAYALLLEASANRVYGDSAFGIARAELAVLDRTALFVGISSTERTPIGGVDYLVVDTAEPLGPDELEVLSNLSSLHAAFERRGDGLLAPLPLQRRAVLAGDIVTIQRYAGKTNEALTHLLVNLAVAESGAFGRLLAGEPLTLIDPACGRGTTLNRAALYGMDAVGIELDERDVEAYTVFLLTWLKDKRLKHRLEQAKLRKGRDSPAHRITITYGEGKDRSAHRVIDVIHDDTTQARTHLKARCADLLVCDLPYGVQHGSQQAGGPLDRGPGGLLRAALPVWFELLRPGAAMALSWNRKTLARPKLAELVERVGFELRSPAEDDAFVHRVDKAILRDVLIAARPR